MTEPKFTRGPWIRANGYFVYSDKYRTIMIGACHPLDGTKEELDRAFANACLFASAPELYDELERIDPNNPALFRARGETPR